MNVSRSVELTPKAKMLYKEARRSRKLINVYKARKKLFKENLKKAKKISVASNSGLKTAAVEFCLQQLNRQATKKRGIRYSFEEKLMALALYKSSGAGYRFLSKMFKLPSKRTLTRLLEGISIESGMSDLLMQNLKNATSHFSEKERICMLMFDEMAIMPHVSFNKNNNRISGIEKGKIIDHVLVFMVRGVTRKWKQTISYSFCKSTTKPAEIKRLIKLIITDLKSIGMYVYFYIC